MELKDIVAEKLKDAESYQMWRFQIDIATKSCGLHDHLVGESKRGGTEKDKLAWDTADNKVQRIIISTIDKSCLVHLLTCTTAFEMNNKIKELFERDTETQKCSLFTKFFSYKYNDGLSVHENVVHLQNIVFRLKSLEENISSEMLIARVLSILPERFSFFTSAWESTPKTEKTLENLMARLTAEEEKKAADNKESTAFNVNVNANSGDRFKTYKCHKCHKTGHIARQCKNKKGFPPCSYCKKTNHLTKNCFFRTKTLDEENNAKAVFVAEQSNKKDVWYVDSGASAHLCNDLKMLDNVKNEVSTFTVANNDKIKSEAVGAVVGESCILKNVMYLPELSSNLMSVSEITENNGKVIFDKSGVVIFQNDKPVLQGNKTSNGLYAVNLKKKERSALLVSAIVWHKKMGHIGIDNLLKLKKMADGIDFTNEKFSCELCIKSKHSRTPFKGKLPKAKRIFELIHIDTCGPFDTPTHDGKNYYVAILDDYSHYSEVYLMRCKSEASDIVKEYILRNENKTNLKLCKIKVDGGTEFKPVIEWCRTKGIVVDITTPYTPQLNGKVERLNRTLCEKMRAILFDSEMGKPFWGEALLLSCYLLNRSPTVGQDVTPIEVWTGKRPNLSKMLVFGCTVYAKKLGYIKKLDERSEKCKFIGYSTVGYRLYSEEKQKVITSRDVVVVDPESCKTKNVSIDLFFDDNPEDSADEESLSDESSVDVENSCNDTDESENSNHSYQLRPRNDIRQPDRLGQSASESNVNDLIGDATVLLTYQEAVTGSDSKNWLEAINYEKSVLDKNNTWSLVKKEEADGHKIISSKWVFRIKENGVFRARLVARGFEQPFNKVEENYSPVVHITSLRTLLAIAASRNLKLYTFDVNSAFIQAECTEKVFMHIPEGYKPKPGCVCKLKRNLYGLRSAPLSWNKKVKRSLEELGLSALKSEPCVFKNNNCTMYLALYVDDGLLLGEPKEMDIILEKLQELFDCKVNRNPSSFLGMEVDVSDKGIRLTQMEYAKNVLTKYNMNEAKPTDTPIVAKEKCDDVKTNITFPYREAIGSLLYLATKTRADIAYAVNLEARFVENPNTVDIQNVKRTLRYVKGTSDLGIWFKKGDINTLYVYCDSDYAGCTDTRRSTSGCICFLNGGPISWWSRRQPIVALSSTEAEFIAAADAIKEVSYIKSLIEELTLNVSVDIVLNMDNTGAMSLIKNGKFNGRSRHIDVRYYFVCEKYQNNFFQLVHCPTEKQVADILTKPLCNIKFQKFRNCIFC